MEASWGGMSAWEAASQEAGPAAVDSAPGAQDAEGQGGAGRTPTGPGGGPPRCTTQS